MALSQGHAGQGAGGHLQPLPLRRRAGGARAQHGAEGRLVQRYEHINNFEKLLYDNGTHILKFYLHIDAEEQLERFKMRIDDPARHWKISDGDYAERPFWDAYTEAFEDALSKCSTEHAPWFIIPSNHKWFRNLAISRIVSETLESLNMKFPEPTVDINEIKKKYHKKGKKGK